MWVFWFLFFKIFGQYRFLGQQLTSVCFLTVRKCHYRAQQLQILVMFGSSEFIHKMAAIAVNTFFCLGPQDTARFPPSAKMQYAFIYLFKKFLGFSLPFWQNVIKSTLHTSINNHIFTTKIKTSLCECWRTCCGGEKTFRIPLAEDETDVSRAEVCSQLQDTCWDLWSIWMQLV